MQVVQKTWVWSSVWEDSLEGVATHPSILAWRIPCAEEPGGLQSTGFQRVGHDWRDWVYTQHKVWIIQNYYVEMIPARMWNDLVAHLERTSRAHWVLSSLSSTHEPPHREEFLCLTPPGPGERGRDQPQLVLAGLSGTKASSSGAPVSRITWWTDLESGHPSRSILTMKMIFVQSQMKKKSNIPL